MSARPSEELAVELLPAATPLFGDAELAATADTAAMVRRRLRASLQSLVVGLLSLVLWFSAWELASRYELDLFFRFENVPAPSEVLLALGELLRTPKFAAHVGNSVLRIFLGFGIAALLALDAQTRLQMQQMLLALWHQLHMTVVFVTHDVDEAVFLSDRVVLLTRRPGSVKAELSISLPRPRTLEVLTSADFTNLKRHALELLLSESRPHLARETQHNLSVR
jgi:hypothetical protein